MNEHDGAGPDMSTSPPRGSAPTLDGVARFAALDLGASSGRVMVGAVSAPRTGAAPATGSAPRVELTEVARFTYEPVLVPPTCPGSPGLLTWDVPALWHGALEGLRTAVVNHGPLAGVGIDSWAVDYGLVDPRGRLLGMPVCYRDPRTQAAVVRAFERVPAAEQYAVNGLQLQPFTTAFQLLAEPDLSAAERALLIPDLLGAWLSGVERAELTNASTTGLLDARTRSWSQDLAHRLGVPPGLLARLIAPGELLGEVRSEVRDAVGLTPADPPLPVWTVGSHDTASAVVATPLSTPRSAYLSCGTWSLLGLELEEPVLTDASRLANVTNEAGLDGTVRYLRNVMGLWVLSETLRTWRAQGREVTLSEALAHAARAEPRRTVVDVDHPSLLPPGDMPARIAHLAEQTGQPVPREVGPLVRCILDSLALAYRRACAQLSRLSGRAVDVVHVVGGGVRNELLMQLTADATGLPVVAGPVEAAALGNVLVQARAAGVLHGTLRDLRRVVTASTTLRRYTPAGGEPDWREAERRAFGVAPSP